MYLRFVRARTRDRERRRFGILHRAESCGGEAERIDRLQRWFLLNLAIPPKPAFSSGRALCWFKADARECIEKARELSSCLERRGVRTWEIYSRNPGLITWSDEHQVVALPDALRPIGC